MKKTTLVFLVVFLLVGSILSCKTEVLAKLYTKDVYTLINEKQDSLTLQSKLLFQIPSEDHLKKNRKKIKRFLNRHFKVTSDLSSKQEKFKTYCIANIEIPLYRSLKEEHPFTYLTVKKTDTIDIFYHLDKQKFKSFKQDAQQEFWAEYDLEEMKMKISLHNDMEDALEYKTYSSYVKNTPVPFGGSFSIKRRETDVITISEVYSKHLINKGKGVILSLPLQNSENTDQKKMKKTKERRKKK